MQNKMEYNLFIWIQGTYAVNNAIIDLSLISRLPIDGYTWMIYMRSFNMKNRRKKAVFCVRFEVRVSLAKGKKLHRT